MFTMMNSERLSVGIQGLGAAEASYQSAVAYARERIQGRSLSGAKAPDKAADPIIVHPDVRRMLLTMRAYTEGCRALGGWVARELDEMERSDDPDARKRAEDFTALMTPIVKALFTDLGFEATNIGMQVYGGHGYIRDHGMEQLVRDARISMIYEGTNGVQALDLVGRKLPVGAGRMLRTFFHPVSEFIERKQRSQATRRDDQGVRQSLRRAATGDRSRSRQRGWRTPRKPAPPRPNICACSASWRSASCGSGRRSLRWRNWHGRMPMPRSTRPNSRPRGSSWSASCRRSAGCLSRSRLARAQ